MEERTSRPIHELIINEQTLPVIEQIGDAMPGGFFIYHADGDEELIYANRAILTIFGCKDLDEFKKLTGFTFPGMLHPDDVERVENTIASQIAANKDDLDYVEYRIVRASGEVRWITDYGHFVRTETYGDVFYVFISDSTDMLFEIQENSLKADVIFGIASDYDTILLLDLLHYTVRPYALNSPSADFLEQALIGREKIEETVRKYTEHFVVEDDRELLLDALDLDRIASTMNDDGHFMLNYRVQDAEGNVQWLRVSLAAAGGDSNYPRVVLGFKNVTEHMLRVEAEAEEHMRIEAELNKALQATQAKHAFLFNMSHDVRTPLNAIVGFATLTRKYINDPVRVAECLDAIDSASDQLVMLVNDVLDMSQLESGSMDIRAVSCSIPEKIKHVTEALAPVAADHQVEMQVLVDDPGVKVRADTPKLRRILSKVIDNAIKYNRAGGKVVIDAHGIEVGDRVDYTFIISDTGIGISPEFKAHLFENFEREANTTHTREYGAGLGLPITKALVNMMDGSIEVESEKGVGTTFTIKLSFEVAPPDAVEQPLATDPEMAAELERIHGKRVLVVEDNELNSLITETILTDAGLLVDIVTDGADAVNTVRHQPPHYYDLVLMDIQMPIMNGYDATRAIRALEREDIAGLPIVALSANALDEDRRMSLESGMNAHLAKPINVSDLLTTLKMYL